MWEARNLEITISEITTSCYNGYIMILSRAQIVVYGQGDWTA